MDWGWVRNLSHLQGAVRHVRTKSVLNGPLTLCALVTLPAWVIALFIEKEFKPVMIIAGFCPMLWFMFQNFFWSIKDPDRLHDEKTQTEWRRMETFGDSANAGNIIDATPTTNPDLDPQEPGK